jgi:hypothetical protein
MPNLVRSQEDYGWFRGMIEYFRRNVRDFQHRRGYATDDYTFMTLMSLILSSAGKAIHALFTLVLALAPVAEVALYLARFSIDNLLDIANTTDQGEMTIKVLFYIHLSFCGSFNTIFFLHSFNAMKIITTLRF